MTNNGHKCSRVLLAASNDEQTTSRGSSAHRVRAREKLFEMRERECKSRRSQLRKLVMHSASSLFPLKPLFDQENERRQQSVGQYGDRWMDGRERQDIYSKPHVQCQEAPTSEDVVYPPASSNMFVNMQQKDIKLHLYSNRSTVKY